MGKKKLGRRPRSSGEYYVVCHLDVADGTVREEGSFADLGGAKACARDLTASCSGPGPDTCYIVMRRNEFDALEDA